MTLTSIANINQFPNPINDINTLMKAAQKMNHCFAKFLSTENFSLDCINNHDELITKFVSQIAQKYQSTLKKVIDIFNNRPDTKTDSTSKNLDKQFLLKVLIQ